MEIVFEAITSFDLKDNSFDHFVFSINLIQDCKCITIHRMIEFYNNIIRLSLLQHSVTVVK